MGHDDHCAAGVGEISEQEHQRAFETRIESGGRLVEQQQRRLGDQLGGHVHALAFATREELDAAVDPLGETELLEHLVEACLSLGLGDVGREPQSLGVAERATHRETVVEQICLRYEPDPAAQRSPVPVEIAILVEHLTLRERMEAREHGQQRRLAGPARTDDRQQRPLVEGESHLVDQAVTAVDLDDQITGAERDQALIDVFLELATDETEVVAADLDEVALGEWRAADAPSVDERAVDALQIVDLEEAARPPQLGVPARNPEVVDDDVVVLVAADTHPFLKPVGRQVMARRPRREGLVRPILHG